jgi:chitinase
MTSSASASSIMRDFNPENFLVRYWINFAHTAKYKTKVHATAANTNQIAIFPNLGTSP